MKLAAAILALSLAFALCSGQANLMDDSTVENTCEGGCKSFLKATLQVKGSGDEEWAARFNCFDNANVDEEKADTVCKPLCGLFQSNDIQQKPRPGSICSLCNANGGAGLQDCRNEIQNNLAWTAKIQCFTSGIVPAGSGVEVYASATVTKDFPGNTDRC